MDTIQYIGLLVKYAIPAAILPISIIVNNILLLTFGLTWLSTSFVIETLK
ncbi:MAG: hypothetical protein ACP5RZ_02620 [Thermoplasmata archaeon]